MRNWSLDDCERASEIEQKHEEEAKRLARQDSLIGLGLGIAVALFILAMGWAMFHSDEIIALYRR